MTAAVAYDADVELMLRVKAGDVDCFAPLLDRHRGPVTHLLFRIVHNRAVAEELAQEVFLRVYRSRDRYEPSAKFTTWLYRIATNRALNWKRDNRFKAFDVSLEPGRDMADRSPNVEQRGVRGASAREIREAVESLPERQRVAVLLHKYEERGYGEIADVFGCSVGAVKSMLFRAYETLREKLAHLAPALH